MNVYIQKYMIYIYILYHILNQSDIYCMYTLYVHIVLYSIQKNTHFIKQPMQIINVHKWSSPRHEAPTATSESRASRRSPLRPPLPLRSPRDPGVRHPGHAEPGTHICTTTRLSYQTIKIYGNYRVVTVIQNIKYHNAHNIPQFPCHEQYANF